MPIREGDEVVYDGEAYTVVQVYSLWDLEPSSALLRSLDGKKLLMAAVGSLKRKGGAS